MTFRFRRFETRGAAAINISTMGFSMREETCRLDTVPADDAFVLRVDDLDRS